MDRFFENHSTANLLGIRIRSHTLLLVLEVIDRDLSY